MTAARTLKTYRVNYNGRTERIVATKSKAEAARLMGCKPSHFAAYGGETGNAEQIAIAMREPGVVWAKSYAHGSTWGKVERPPTSNTDQVAHPAPPAMPRTTMDRETQRIIIAEACGTMRWSTALPRKTVHCDVPQYPSFIDAMHEAEETLTKEQGLQYAENLSIVLTEANRGTPRWLGPTAFDYLHATARQRAEAFIRMLGKWVD